MALLIASFAAIYIIWGSTYLAIQWAVQALPPFLMAGTRFLLSGLILYPIVRQGQPRPTAANWRAAALVGSLLMIGGNGLVCWAETRVPSGVAALLIATVPIWFATLDWLFYHGPRPTLMKVAGLAGGTLGVYLLLGAGKLGGEPVNVAGAVALLCACVFWATGSLHARRAALPKSAFMTAAMEMLIGGAVSILIGTLLGEWSHVNFAAIGARSLWSYAYLITVGSIVAITAYSWLIQNASPARVSTYAYVNPVIAVLLGAWLNHEALSPRVLLASTVIISAVVLMTLSARKRSRPTARVSSLTDDPPAATSPVGQE